MADTDNVWEKGLQKQESRSLEASRKDVKSYSDIDFRRVLAVWPFIILFGILGFGGGHMYLRYIQTVYLVNTSINIEQKEEVTIGEALSGSTRDPFNDKIEYFKSPILALQLVDSLGLQYHSIIPGTFKDKDYYALIKWRVISSIGLPELPPIRFSLLPEAKRFTVNYNGVSFVGNWGVPFILGKEKIVVDKLRDFISSNAISCYTTDRLSEAFQLSAGISIVSSGQSNIIKISYQDYSSERAIDILNGLTKLYNHILEQDKTQSFSQAINFIDGRLAPLARELDSIETSLASYKSSRGFIGTSANGELYIEKMKEFNKELNDINIIKSTIASVEKFIQNPTLKDENLAMIGVTDPFLQSSVAQYQQLRIDRDKLQMTLSSNHPNMVLLEEHLAELKDNLNVQLQNYKKNLAIAEANYQQNLASANALLKNTPAEEKELLDKSRLQNIKETLFLTMLQKREEAAISKASVTVNTKVLSPPVKINSQQKPDRNKILASAFLIGLIAPLVFAVVKELLNKKIISKRQIQSITNIPVLAELAQVENVEGKKFVIGVSDRSIIGEQLRTLRTSLNFYNSINGDSRYILITSSMSGEGKSFLALNLARSYSLQGKKVALLEFDLRRPKMGTLLNVPANHHGLSAVLLGTIAPQNIALVPEGIQDNETLHFFPAGTIPPNPQELLSGKHVEVLKKYLDSNYDIVIIDTPPYGIVADAQILGEWADVTLVVTRFQQTIVDQVKEIAEWQRLGTFNSMAIIFNGIRNKGYFGYRYGYYYYKSKYGGGYYNEPQGDSRKRKFFSAFIKKS